MYGTATGRGRGRCRYSRGWAPPCGTGQAPGLCATRPLVVSPLPWWPRPPGSWRHHLEAGWPAPHCGSRSTARWPGMVAGRAGPPAGTSWRTSGVPGCGADPAHRPVLAAGPAASPRPVPPAAPRYRVGRGGLATEQPARALQPYPCVAAAAQGVRLAACQVRLAGHARAGGPGMPGSRTLAAERPARSTTTGLRPRLAPGRRGRRHVVVLLAGSGCYPRYRVGRGGLATEQPASAPALPLCGRGHTGVGLGGSPGAG